MTDEFLTAEIASESATIVETIELPRGEETKSFKIEVREADIGEVREFERREEEGDEAEDELVQEVLDDYLIKPEGLNVDDLGNKTIDAIMRGVFRAWGASESDIDEALEDRSGN